MDGWLNPRLNNGFKLIPQSVSSHVSKGDHGIMLSATWKEAHWLMGFWLCKLAREHWVMSVCYINDLHYQLVNLSGTGESIFWPHLVNKIENVYYFYAFLDKFSTRRVRLVCPIQCDYIHQQSEITIMLLAPSHTLLCRAQSSNMDCDWKDIYIHLICLYLELFTADHCCPVCNKPRSFAGSHIST